MISKKQDTTFISDKSSLDCFETNVQSIIIFQKGMHVLEQWAVAYLLAIFQKKGLFKSVNDIHDFNSMKYDLNMLDKYDGLLQSLLEIFSRYNYISEVAKNIYETSHHIQTIDKYKLENVFLNIIQTYQNVKSNAIFLKRVLDNYLNVLSGRNCFLSIMFPNGGFYDIEHIYKINPDASYYNYIVSQIIKLLIEKHKIKKQNQLSIIELGAGIGSTTELILPILNIAKINCNYLYTDISKAFIRYFEKKINKKYDFISYATLDIEKRGILQGIEEKKYDIVIATNVLHVSKNISNAIANAKYLLRPDGKLIINEGITKNDFATLAFGLSDGWWAFEDDQVRLPGSPFISLSNWKELLFTAGFQKAYSLNKIIHPNIKICQDVIVGVLDTP